MKRLLIGIPGFQNKDNMFGVTGNYMEYANSFGDVRIIMPHEERVQVDLLMLPGGMDLNPSSYGEVPGYQTGHQDVFKQHFFDKRLANYVGNTAIFGICLGFQQLNVFFGGKLVQNDNFHQNNSTRWAEAHDVVVRGDNKAVKFKVNSHHHQMVTMDNIAENLTPLVWAGEKLNSGVVEAFAHADLPIGGVQWHPEEFYDGFSDYLIRDLISRGEKLYPQEKAQEEPAIQ